MAVASVLDDIRFRGRMTMLHFVAYVEVVRQEELDGVPVTVVDPSSVARSHLMVRSWFNGSLAGSGALNS